MAEVRESATRCVKKIDYGMVLTLMAHADPTQYVLPGLVAHQVFGNQEED